MQTKTWFITGASRGFGVRIAKEALEAGDNVVATAYGWDDFDLGHGFHTTKQGTRFTLSEPARREVLARLLTLNHQRYEEEVRKGLHDKKKTHRGRKKKDSPSSTPALFT